MTERPTGGRSALVPPDSRIRTALGLHPELAAVRARELPLFEQLLSRTRFVGEVGLDGSREHRATLDKQQSVLADILTLCARAGGKIISLHSRGAASLLLDALEREPDAGKAVLHWFVGSSKQVTRGAAMGCWFSVGPSMLVSERGRVAVTAMPRHRVLPESDGPFGQIENRPARPWEAWSVVAGLAELWRESEVDVAHQLRANLRALVTV